MDCSNENVDDIMNQIRQSVKKARNMRSVGSGKQSAKVIPGITCLPCDIQLENEMANIHIKWDLPGEWDIISGRKHFGKIIVLVKRAIRKLMRWYINPSVEQQRDFNGSVARALQLMDELMKRFTEELTLEQEGLSMLTNDVRALKEVKSLYIRQNEELVQRQEQEGAMLRRTQTRVGNLEKFVQNLTYELSSNNNVIGHTEHSDKERQNAVKEMYMKAPPVSYISEQLAGNEFDYFLFENRFRGPRKLIKDRQMIYVEYFMGVNNLVADLGCGRGEFVEVLMNHGIEAVGVDNNADMVAYCKDNLLPVVESDALLYLESLPDRHLGGIFCAQVVEHLEAEQIIRFIKLAALKLRPGGILLIETLNPQVLYIYANQFYMDLTHKQPIHPRTLEFLMQSQGFHDITIRYSAPVEEMKIPVLEIVSLRDDLTDFNNGIERLNQLLFGEQDYAIIGIC